jgi:hypothetical protein
MMVEIRFDVLVELAEELQQTDTRLRALEFAVQAVKEQYKTEVKT